MQFVIADSFSSLLKSTQVSSKASCQSVCPQGLGSFFWHEFCWCPCVPISETREKPNLCGKLDNQDVQWPHVRISWEALLFLCVEPVTKHRCLCFLLFLSSFQASVLEILVHSHCHIEWSWIIFFSHFYLGFTPVKLGQHLPAMS